MEFMMIADGIGDERVEFWMDGQICLQDEEEGWKDRNERFGMLGWGDWPA
tara:strand:+ start:1008 stop:1157 length:150 start_codon:yes stop_codon:yes gene_type:complete